MIPIIALIGRQNVGKSTLFNCLTHTTNALVANHSGLTRDRKYGIGKFFGKNFIFIDTAGLYNIQKDIEKYIQSQIIFAIKESNIIFFIVDIRSGLLLDDNKIIQYLRTFNKPIYLIVNKIDGININNFIVDFYNFGIKNIFLISASHGNGIIELIKQVNIHCLSFENTINDFKFSKKNQELFYWFTQTQQTYAQNNISKKIGSCVYPIKLAIIGKPNVGKSTLVNRFVDNERVVVCDIPGTTRDSIYIPMEYNGNHYLIIDTAGIRKKWKKTKIYEKFSVIKTLQSIKDAHVVLLIINAMEGISDQDLSLLNFIFNTGRSFIVVINKWDILSSKERKLIKHMLNFKLNFLKFVKIHFISALYNVNIAHIFSSINQVYISATKPISNSLLMRIMKLAETKNPPPLIRGQKIKMKYIHIGGYNPLIFIIHGNKVISIPIYYKRYLINFFSKILNIIGTPIRIYFKEGSNPYINKKK